MPQSAESNTLDSKRPEHGDLGPEALFSMYLDRAIEDDKKMVEGWKSNTDGILIFVSLHITSHASTYILKL